MIMAPAPAAAARPAVRLRRFPPADKRGAGGLEKSLGQRAAAAARAQQPGQARDAVARDAGAEEMRGAEHRLTVGVAARRAPWSTNPRPSAGSRSTPSAS